MKSASFAVLLLLSPILNYALSAAELEDILTPFEVTATNVSTFQSAVWASGGIVYTADVQPPEGWAKGINLRSVVRQGHRASNGAWTWTEKLIEDRTIDSPWHTVPSISVDSDHFVHVAYNMHNMPWQYSVSHDPQSIDAFDFRGEALSLFQIGEVHYLNQTPFPRLGKAAIPGTQVTYPSFYADRKGTLWVTYRFALKPKRTWAERVYGCGIARYDTTTRSWTAIGGKVPVGRDDAAFDDTESGEVTAFCANANWWANDIRLWFDENNAMHVVWCWSDYLTSEDPHKRREFHAYAKSTDGGLTFTHSNGEPFKLPIDFASSEMVSPTGNHYGGTSLTTDHNGNPVIAIQRHEQAFQITRLDPTTHRWTYPEASPFGASVIINDGKGKLWAFAGGPTIFKSSDQPPFFWSKVYEAHGWDHLKVFYAADEGAFYLRLMKCEETVKVAKRDKPLQNECVAKISRLQLEERKRNSVLTDTEYREFNGNNTR